MVSFIGIPQLHAPDNMNVDFGPINDLIETYRKRGILERGNKSLVDALQGGGQQQSSQPPMNALMMPQGQSQGQSQGPSQGMGPSQPMSYGIANGAKNAMFDMGNLSTQQPGAVDRSGFHAELQDPAVRNGLLALTHAEVGNQGPEAKQAFMESVMNRAAARGVSLNQAINDHAYYPAITQQRAAQGLPESALNQYAPIYDKVSAGSNMSNYATGNASGTVGFNGGPQTAAYGGERFGIEGPDRKWASQYNGGQGQQPSQPASPQASQPLRTADASGGIDPRIADWLRNNPNHPAAQEILGKLLEQRMDPMQALHVQQAQASLRDTELEHETKVAKAYARVAQSVLAETDPQKQIMMNQHLMGSHPDLARMMQQHGINPNDPLQAAKFLTERAQEYEDPIKEETQKLNLAMLKKNLNAKDSGEVKEVDGTLVRIPPDKSSAAVIYGGGTGKLPQGYMRDPKNPGAFIPVPGGPGDHLTEGESKDALFAERMIRAERDLSSVIPTDKDGKFTKYNPTGPAQNWMPDDPKLSNLYTANFLNSKEWQQYRRAARESLSAILRKDTGAAVTDEEFATYFPTYFPVPGDSPQVIKQKESARNMVAQGLRGASSRAFGRMFPNYDAVNGGLKSGGGNKHDLGDGFTMEVH